MQKLTLIETVTVTEGTIENPVTPYEISLEKGIDSAINSLITRIHHLGTAFKIGKTKGASVVYSIEVDGCPTSIAFGSGIGLAIKENSKEAYLKEAGLKKMTLTAFTMDYTAFRIAHPVIASVVKYHLGAYLDAETRAESYKNTAKAIFKKDIKEGKSDLVSWSVQTRATAEKSLYGIQDYMEKATAENTDDYMEQRRESSRRAIAFKSEQRKIAAAAKK